MQDYLGAATLSMTSPFGTPVPVGAFTVAPSPLPSPLASGSGAYLAAPLPTLAAATTYTLTFVYPDFNGLLPTCVGPVNRAIGSFTTQ